MIRALSTRTHRAAAAGFTLIELLVVIGVILLLAALVITVSTSLVEQSEVRETQNTMRLLDVAVQEWEIAAERPVMYGVDGEPCGANDANLPFEQYQLEQLVGDGVQLTDDGLATQTTDLMWELFSRNSEVRELLAGVNTAFLEELDPDDHNHLTTRSFRVLDAWENPIIAVLAGRRHDPDCDGTDYTVINNRPDDDGTIRTPFENRYGVATDRRIYFVSAGPDGQFGNLRLDESRGNLNADDEVELGDAEDNVYSYPVLIEEMRP